MVSRCFSLRGERGKRKEVPGRRDPATTSHRSLVFPAIRRGHGKPPAQRQSNTAAVRWCPVSVSPDTEQFDFKDEVGVGRDHAAGSLAPIAQGCGNDEAGGFAADLDAGDAFISSP